MELAVVGNSRMNPQYFAAMGKLIYNAKRAYGDRSPTVTAAEVREGADCIRRIYSEAIERSRSADPVERQRYFSDVRNRIAALAGTDTRSESEYEQETPPPAEGLRELVVRAYHTWMDGNRGKACDLLDEATYEAEPHQSAILRRIIRAERDGFEGTAFALLCDIVDE